MSLCGSSMLKTKSARRASMTTITSWPTRRSQSGGTGTSSISLVPKNSYNKCDYFWEIFFNILDESQFHRVKRKRQESIKGNTLWYILLWAFKNKTFKINIELEATLIVQTLTHKWTISGTFSSFSIPKRVFH